MARPRVERPMTAEDEAFFAGFTRMTRVPVRGSGVRELTATLERFYTHLMRCRGTEAVQDLREATHSMLEALERAKQEG